jgi:N-acetylneuraminic acid mutarotase
MHQVIKRMFGKRRPHPNPGDEPMDDRPTIKLPGARRTARAGRHRVRALTACVAFALVACVPAAAQAADGWSPAASLGHARGGHVATLLANGNVLVTGGYDRASGQGAELYDSRSDTWSEAASPNVGDGPSVTLLASGKVLAAGGYDGDDSGGPGVARLAALYDPASGAWSPAASMISYRYGHTATLLASGKVLVVGGGSGDDLKTAELYDPVRNTWSPAGSLSTVRSYHTATLLANGKVLVAGGADYDASGQSFETASAELYDPLSNTWSPGASMTAPRSQATATLLADGEVLLAGGYVSPSATASAEVYDPVRDAWTPVASMSTPRREHTATLLASGKVLVTGGGDYLIGSTASAELYDPAHRTWSPAPSMSIRRRDHTATLLPSGKVLVAAGNIALGVDGFTASAQLYGPVVAAPQTTITAGPSGVTADPTPSFAFKSSRAGSTFACSVSGVASFTPCSSGATFGPLVDGSYTFRVRATASGSTDQTPATRTFTVRAAPRAVGDAYTTDLGASLVVSAPGVLRNDSDPNGDLLRAVLVSGPAHGTLTLNADGSLRYMPREDYIGADSFVYKASDGSQRSAAATVRLRVRAACGGVAATEVGTSGADTLTGTSGADVIVGLGGNDRIRGLAGNDRVCGGSGADSIAAGSGDDVLIGGSGKDVLRGDVGNDRLYGGAGADMLFGDGGNDRLDGGANAPDSCQGGSGSDTVADSCERIS